MAKGAARDANKTYQNISLELPTETFIKLARVLDPVGFNLDTKNTEVKRAKGTAKIRKLECDVTLIESWIVETIKVEADKAKEAYDAKRQALKDELRAEILAELEAEGKSTKKAAK